MYSSNCDLEIKPGVRSSSATADPGIPGADTLPQTVRIWAMLRPRTGALRHIQIEFQ
jgi:hypothetical protein